MGINKSKNPYEQAGQLCISSDKIAELISSSFMEEWRRDYQKYCSNPFINFGYFQNRFQTPRQLQPQNHHNRFKDKHKHDPITIIINTGAPAPVTTPTAPTASNIQTFPPPASAAIKPTEFQPTQLTYPSSMCCPAVCCPFPYYPVLSRPALPPVYPQWPLRYSVSVPLAVIILVFLSRYISLNQHL